MQNSQLQSPITRRLPRFGLRALLLAVVLVAVLLQIVPLAWRHFVRYRESRQYANIQAPKQWSDSDESYSIDDGRGTPDDFVILVRRGNSYGCFIPRNQYKKGESVEFDWYYRSDGLARFEANDPQVQSGHSLAGPYVPNGGGVVIRFAEFEIPWSGHGPGWGFIYYPYNVEDRSAPDILRICATDQKTLDYIDGRDSRWVYKGYPGDTGIRGDQPAVSK